MSISSNMHKQLQLSKRAFWDVDFDQLMKKADNYPEFIVRKVFEHGTFQDVVNVTRYFGKSKTIEILKKTHFLPEKTLHFAAAMFKIDKSEFKCYTNKPQRHFYTKHSRI